MSVRFPSYVRCCVCNAKHPSIEARWVGRMKCGAKLGRGKTCLSISYWVDNNSMLVKEDKRDPRRPENYKYFDEQE